MTPVDKPTMLSRGLRVFDAFSAEATTLTVSEISRRIGVPLSTTFRLVVQLTAWGGLERTEDGSYRVGLRLWEVASLAPRATGLRQVALPFLQDLYEITHHSVHLAVREGEEVMFVERLVGRDAEPTQPRVGGRYAMHATAVGLVLLAHAPPDLQEGVLAGPLPAVTPYTYQDPRQLRAVLADVRRRGYAVSDRQANPELLSVAAPVVGPAGGTAAAVSVVVPSDEAEPVKLSQLVRTTARAISRACGRPVVDAPTASFPRSENSGYRRPSGR